MELTASFSFSIPLKFSNIDRPFDVGHFRGSKWSLLVDSIQHIRIIRSNGVGGFAVNVNISFYNVQLSSLIWKEHWMGFIIEHETSVHISLPFKGNVQGVNTLFGEFKGTVSILQLPEVSSNTSSSPQLPDDFLRLLNNPFFPGFGSDKIIVKNGLLSVRSPVVAEMLNKMQESSGGDVDIVDIGPNVLQATLEYVYRGKTDEIAGHLLRVADNCNLEELRRVCVEKLKTSVTEENVFRILALGDSLDESLKTHAMKFVCECGKFSNLENTIQWKMFMAESPLLAIEVLAFVVKHLQEIRPPA